MSKDRATWTHFQQARRHEQLAAKATDATTRRFHEDEADRHFAAAHQTHRAR